MLTPSASRESAATWAATLPPSRDDDLDRVGEVQLALHVVRLDPLERGPEHVGAEDVDRRVDLADLLLLLVRVGALDDAQHGAVGAADDAAVERAGRAAPR